MSPASPTLSASAVTKTWRSGTVSLQLTDDKGGVIDLKLMMVDQAQAKAVAKRFQEAPQKLYGRIIQALTAENE